MLKVYIANPYIFSPATKEWYVNTMIPVVARHVQVINAPTEEPQVDMSTMTDAERSKWIFDLNVELLDEADFVICVSDGVQTDDGTAWEVGYAWAQGKPTIGVRFDVRDGCREKFSTFTNLMIENCCLDFAYDLKQLDEVLEKFVQQNKGGCLNEELADPDQGDY